MGSLLSGYHWDQRCDESLEASYNPKSVVLRLAALKDPSMSAATAPVKATEKALASTSISPPERKERSMELDGITYKTYTHEKQLDWIVDLMKKDLSEPYSVYTYRYFINNWPDLCWLVRSFQ